MTFGLFLARKVSLVRAIMYMVAQCVGAICGCGLVKAFQRAYYVRYGGGANNLEMDIAQAPDWRPRLSALLCLFTLSSPPRTLKEVPETPMFR